MRALNLGVDGLDLKSYLCHIFIVGPWAGYFTSKPSKNRDIRYAAAITGQQGSCQRQEVPNGGRLRFRGAGNLADCVEILSCLCDGHQYQLSQPAGEE